jgi:hypothetical protein
MRSIVRSRPILFPRILDAWRRFLNRIKTRIGVVPTRELELKNELLAAPPVLYVLLRVDSALRLYSLENCATDGEAMNDAFINRIEGMIEALEWAKVDLYRYKWDEPSPFDAKLAELRKIREDVMTNERKPADDKWGRERIILENGNVLSDGGPVICSHYVIGKPNQICEKGKWYVPVKEEIIDGTRTVTVRLEGAARPAELREAAPLSERDRKRLEALREADEALYRLWKQSEVNSQEMAAINALQEKFIHPAIREMEGR